MLEKRTKEEYREALERIDGLGIVLFGGTNDLYNDDIMMIKELVDNYKENNDE